MLAEDKSGLRITARRSGEKAVCPTCGSEVVAKCGLINVWHWAHVGRDECDRWAEPESEWHQGWKKLLPEHQTEVTIEKIWGGKKQKHRADIQATDGTVIELQHSTIATEEIFARESFYGRMAWIFDSREVWEAERFELEEHENYYSFRWKYPRKHVAHARTTRYLHFDDNLLFRIGKMHINFQGACRGWGRFVDIQRLVTEWQRNIGEERYTH